MMAVFHRAGRQSALVVIVAALLHGEAFAQAAPGPFGGLFGRTPERIGREFTALELRSAFAGQYDDGVFLDESVPDDSRPKSGATAGANAGVAFERQTDRTRLLFQTGATYQEFIREDRSFGATTNDAELLYRAQVTTRLQVEGSARYLRSPFFRLLPGVVVPAPGTTVVIPGDQYVVRRLLNDTYDVTGSFTSQYTKSSFLTASLSQRQTKFADRAADTFDVLSAHGQWKRRLSRDFALRLGYGRERIRQGNLPDSEFVHEVVDVGIDFLKQLSVARKTTLDITTQTSMVKRPITGRRYRLNGTATLSRYFRRTWHASLGASRATEFLPGFAEPLLSESAAASVSGLLRSRLEWMSSISAGRGQFGFDGDRRLLTSHATTRLNWAMTRHFGIYGQYGFYYYELPQGTAAVKLLPQLSRQSFTFGVTAWVPIINKVRMPRDPE